MPISGSYPCCDGPLFLWLTDGDDGPEITDKWYKHECEHCGTWVWTRLGHFAQSYTEENFVKEFEIDEVTKTIKKRGEDERHAT